MIQYKTPVVIYSKYQLEAMRDRKGWMNKATDPVLEVLEQNVVLNAKSIWLTLRLRQGTGEAPGENTIRRALDDLSDHGFIVQVTDQGTYYRITDRGRRYLNEEPVEDNA